jgi:hypothetical protein
MGQAAAACLGCAYQICTSMAGLAWPAHIIILVTLQVSAVLAN